MRWGNMPRIQRGSRPCWKSFTSHRFTSSIVSSPIFFFWCFLLGANIGQFPSKLLGMLHPCILYFDNLFPANGWIGRVWVFSIFRYLPFTSTSSGGDDTTEGQMRTSEIGRVA
ncbi:hypothetical protein BU24DRAFT_242276 [Aaosphaeria arxii CBS 175.79]|uniref:Uncharacterized protein n=1 Tax=Aaosphaeria arxii CBS 175.79 TaxID=1450172 RepID=A0A6A5XK39_9PLEO|nr:uncharacterized protein BU24DRAFT_242276 [Aaosphaeria arxii CBS 175.79]KAF2013648.1 hypothetical protein BU24DRAFT_242276 [Aaosphaeria arxii CBS 175.79]